MTRDVTNLGGPIAWMARNPVAANLLMIVIIVAGIVGILSVKQEVFPEFSLDMVTVSVPYPGASPEEVEQGIVLALEEAVSGIDGVKRVTSNSSEGLGMVSVELLLGANGDVVLRDVASEVDRITTFPEDAEEPIVSLVKPKRQVVSLVISGDQDLRSLHVIAESARLELLSKEGITQVEIDGVPPLEISIEISRENLEAFGLTLDDVARQIRAASLELPGGAIEARSGEIMVRVADRSLSAEEFESIVVRGTTGGFNLRLGDIAEIRDGFADTDQEAFHDGHPAVRLTAYRVGNETPAGVAAAVREFADELREELPESVTVAVLNDDSVILSDRINLLLTNAVMGFLLVILLLTLFLKARLAGWVALGIPISFMGAFALMSVFGQSINMISLFALIITLGLVVDDAIIVGENAYSKVEAGIPRMQAAIEGAREMAIPVAFSILTTVAAFAPLFFVPGIMGKIFFIIPSVVVSVLFFSLAESFGVLPAHLAHGGDDRDQGKRGILSWPGKIPKAVSHGLEWFTHHAYEPFLGVVLRWRYATVAVAFALLVLTVSLVASGTVRFSFFPALEGDLVTAAVRLPFGAPEQDTEAIRDELERAANRAIDDLGGPDKLLRSMYTRVGEGVAHKMGPREVGSHLVTIELSLTPSAEREVTSAQIAKAWNDFLPRLDGVESLVINHSVGPGAGAAVDLQMSHTDQELLARASEEMTQTLRGYSDLTSVQNDWSAGKPRLDFRLLPEARQLGLTNNDVARQIRGAFYGSEALREQRGRNELKIMVRLPEAERRSEQDLDRMLIRTPAGGNVPLFQVASFERSVAPSQINREDGHRIVNVKGELQSGVASAQDVIASLNKTVIPDFQERYPGLEVALVGMQREQAESFAALGKYYIIALFVMFAMLAIPFRSYVQPLIIMSAIPFGFIGAIFGHLLMGYNLSFISVLGIIALSGVVVNNSLVLIDSTNGYRASGASAAEAITQGGVRRLRPILLTSLTTFFGLMPMILETSVQARFLIPMAISLGFGVLFSTFIGLLLVPALYMVVEDFRGQERVHEPVEPRNPAAQPATIG